MSEQDIIQYLSSRKFTVLWSGGKDSTAVLLWVLNNIPHEKWNVVYVEVTGNTHELCNLYIQQVSKELGIHNKLIYARREDLDFFECLKKWGVPIFGKYRWCLNHFKQKVFNKHSHFIQVSGVRRSDSYRRKKVKFIEFYRQTGRLAVQPLLTWTKKQVLEYIRAHDVPINPCYGLFRHSGNCMFCPYHNTAQIILTLQDPKWRDKILDALQSQNNKGSIKQKVLKWWLRRAPQLTLTSSLLSVK